MAQGSPTLHRKFLDHQSYSPWLFTMGSLLLPGKALPLSFFSQQSFRRETCTGMSPLSHRSLSPQPLPPASCSLFTGQPMGSCQFSPSWAPVLPVVKISRSLLQELLPKASSMLQDPTPAQCFVVTCPVFFLWLPKQAYPNGAVWRGHLLLVGGPLLVTLPPLSHGNLTQVAGR